jgi:hypothetical protein
MKKIPSRKKLRIGQLRQFIGIYEDRYFYVISYDPTKLSDENYCIRFIGDGEIKYGCEDSIIFHSVLIEEPRSGKS